MAGVPPLRASAYAFNVCLVSQADTDIFKVNPTLAVGDVKVSLDGGALNNVTDLPTVIGAGKLVNVTLTAAEMTADRVMVVFCDAAGDEWQDLAVLIETETAQINDLAQPGDAMTLEDDAITSAKYDESTAFPVKAADTGASQIARVGADGDTLETLSDQLDTAQADLDAPNQYKADVAALAIEANVEGHAADALTAWDPPTQATMEARTLLAADYFDPATDTVANVTTTGTVTDKAGFSLSAAGILAIWHQLVAGIVTANTIGKRIVDYLTGDVFGRLGAPAGASIAADIAAAQADLDNPDQYKANVAALALEANVEGHAADALTAWDPPTQATMELALAGLNDLSAAEVNAQVVDALTVDVIADSVSADGSRPTIAQALYEIVQFLQERAVSGTTVTVKKPDGTTSLMTLTLDDATSPTSITRAS